MVTKWEVIEKKDHCCQFSGQTVIVLCQNMWNCYKWRQDSLIVNRRIYKDTSFISSWLPAHDASSYAFKGCLCWSWQHSCHPSKLDKNWFLVCEPHSLETRQNWNTLQLYFRIHYKWSDCLQEMIWHFGKSAYSLSCKDLDWKIRTTLMSVCVTSRHAE